MATKFMRFCDVCEEPATRPTVTFGWDLAFYEADLCEEHGEQLGDVIERLSRVGRRVGKQPGIPKESEARPPARAQVVDSRKARPHRRRKAVSTATVRAWAKEQGLEVSDYGRVSGEVMSAYEQATRSS